MFQWITKCPVQGRQAGRRSRTFISWPAESRLHRDGWVPGCIKIVLLFRLRYWHVHTFTFPLPLLHFYISIFTFTFPLSLLLFHFHFYTFTFILSLSHQIVLLLKWWYWQCLEAGLFEHAPIHGGAAAPAEGYQTSRKKQGRLSACAYQWTVQAIKLSKLKILWDLKP